MNDQAFLEAIMTARREDPGPRLVYADVLAQRGDFHGELITIVRAELKILSGARASS